MDFRKSLSKLFKKLKDKLPGSSRKRGSRSGSEDNRKGREVDIKGGGVGQRNQYLSSELDAEGAMSGASQEGSNTDGKKAAHWSISIPPHPRLWSHTSGNLTVCEQCYFQFHPLIGLSRQCGQLYCSQSNPRCSQPQPEQVKHYR